MYKILRTINDNIQSIQSKIEDLDLGLSSELESAFHKDLENNWKNIYKGLNKLQLELLEAQGYQEPNKNKEVK